MYCNQLRRTYFIFYKYIYLITLQYKRAHIYELLLHWQYYNKLNCKNSLLNSLSHDLQYTLYYHQSSQSYQSINAYPKNSIKDQLIQVLLKFPQLYLTHFQVGHYRNLYNYEGV